MSSREYIMGKIRELAAISRDFYRIILETYKKMKNIEDEELGKHINEFKEYQTKYSEETCDLIKILPKDASLRMYYDIISSFQEIKHHLENLFITVIYGSRTPFPEPIKDSLDEAMELPLKAFEKMINALEQYDSKEKLRENINDISKIEGVMDQSHIMLIRQINTLKGKEDDFALMIVYKIAHSIEGIIDVLEDISNYLSR